MATMGMFRAGIRSDSVTGQAFVVHGGGLTGVMWSDQRAAYKTHRPIKVYNPDRS